MTCIRLMTEADLPLGMRLKALNGWSQTEADWRRYLELQPDGCFVAGLDGEPVGTLTTCIFGTVGWIMGVFVDRRHARAAVTGVIVMHSASCPSCGTRVEFDFLPIAGHVWCPTCQKLFSPPAVSGPKPEKTEQGDASGKRNGQAG